MEEASTMDQVVEFTTPDGRVFQFRLGMVLPFEDETYVVLIELEPDTAGEEQILITRLVSMSDGDDQYVVIDDERIIDEVFQQYTAACIGETLAACELEEEPCHDPQCEHPSIH